MAKNVRRRKREVRARRADEARRRERDRRVEEMVRRVQELVRRKVEAILDSATPVEEAASHFLDLYEEERLPPPGMARLLEADGPPSRARELAEAVLRRAPDRPAALALAAEVALAGDDAAEAARLLERAAKRSEAPELRSRLADAYLQLDRVADALDLLDALCREDPTDDEAQTLRMEALERAHAHRQLDPKDPCPCRSGKRYGRCCRPQERAALDRFEDRDPLYRLRAALDEYVGRPEFQELREVAWDDWYGDADPEDLSDEVMEEAKLWMERAFLVIPVDRRAPDGPENTVLGRFAADPDTPPDLARLAGDWLELARYGLWQVADPRPGPGLLLADLLTGTRLYAALAPEQAEGLARWSVLLGVLLPLDGVWRTGGAFVPLSPDQGEALAEEVFALARRAAPKLLGKRDAPPVRRAIDERRRLLRSGPVEEAPPADPAVAVFLDRVAAASLPMLNELVRQWRSAPMPMTNTDGEPLLLITARIEVGDRDALDRGLKRHPDFAPADDGYLWYGEEMPAMAHAMALAELRAVAEREGAEVEDAGPRRWVRAHLRVEGSVIEAEVNSRERLDRLLGLLREMELRPRVVSEHRIDPARDFPVPAEMPAPRDQQPLSPEAEAAWQRAWLDEEVPALGGLTPRQAARDRKGRVALEALLRDFEHREDRSRALGARDPEGPGVEALRAALGMDRQ